MFFLLILLKRIIVGKIVRPLSLSELTTMIFNMGLTGLGLEASIWYDIIWRNHLLVVVVC